MTEPLITLPVSEYNRLVTAAIKRQKELQAICLEVTERVAGIKAGAWSMDRDPLEDLLVVLRLLARAEPLPPKVET